MKSAQIFAISLLLTSCTPKQDVPKNDTAVMISAMNFVSHFTQGEWGNEIICADLVLEGDAFRDVRFIPWMDRERYDSGIKEFISEWFDPIANGDGRYHEIFDRKLQGELASAAYNVLKWPPPSIVRQRMMERVVPKPFTPRISPRRDKDGCASVLFMTSPSYSGDFAFVDYGVGCGDLCGWGTILALKRKGEDWEVVAFLPTWVS